MSGLGKGAITAIQPCHAHEVFHQHLWFVNIFSLENTGESMIDPLKIYKILPLSGAGAQSQVLA